MRLSVRTKLIGTSSLLLAITVALGLLSVLSLGSVRDAAATMADNAASVRHLTTIDATLIDERRLVDRGLAYIKDAAAQAPLDTALAADDAAIKSEIDAFAEDAQGAEEKAGVADFQKAFDGYLELRNTARAKTLAGDATAAKAAADSARPAVTAAQDAIDKLVKINDAEDADLLALTGSTYDSGRLLTIGFVLVGVLVGLAVSFLMARGFTNGVKAVQATLTSLADRCATDLAKGLGAFAANDLTVAVVPVTTPIDRYGTDEIGQTARVTNVLVERIQQSVDSYEQARTSLIATVGEVKRASETVAHTSGDVNAAATQSGQASGQIAATIGQVASGAADQASAASQTSDAVQELTAVIEQVRAGAAETATKVEAASAAVMEMSVAIDGAMAASGEVSTVSGTAAGAAENGTDAVRRTVAGMDRIKEAVEGAAARVTELGAKSDQIGAIVETIDDIAEQTNLLALNAAIEAARAGEQGKGFAVVADEVRKLAERSGRATKEIAGLIGEVQKGTEQAVAAMQAGAVEVQQGITLANEAGSSLGEIATTVGATRAAADRITAAVDAMTRASSGVVAASDAIGTIASQTNAAAARMTAAASSVGQSVESIAAISEENSAATEEVSAATQEMSAQAEEVVAAAASLAEMASQLDVLVARFRLSEDEQLSDKIETYRQAHRAWVRRLENMLTGSERIDLSEIGDHTTCALGKWYHGSGQAQTGSSPEFKAIDAPHRAMHAAVRAAVKACNAGNRAEAARSSDDVRRHSADVIRALDGLERSLRGGIDLADRRRVHDETARRTARQAKVA